MGAALQQRSDFFADPWDRLFRSIPPILGVVFDAADQDTAGAVRRFHTEIKGLDTQGKHYHALNPEVFWWTHLTFVESMICPQEYFGTPLTAAEKDQLVAEGLTWWRRYGLSDRPGSADAASFDAYWDHVLDTVLEDNDTTRWVTSADCQPRRHAAAPARAARAVVAGPPTRARRQPLAAHRAAATPGPADPGAGVERARRASAATVRGRGPPGVAAGAVPDRGRAPGPPRLGPHGGAPRNSPAGLDEQPTRERR